jgi:stage II sporulation protein E
VPLLEAEPYSVSVGIASMKKKGESVSGDRGTYFKTDQGVLCILLSDGMGSGESAARESTAAVRILERFLRTGVDPAVAMRILNSVLLLKNETEWGFATVDLMCIDLFTGDTAFYKYGAAPSYVRCGRTVRRVRSENLAAGLMPGDKCAPDIVRLRMKPGYVALIASDGVIAETKDDWIRALLADHAAADTKELARETLKTALTQYGCSDDMTVLAVRMDSRA